MLQPSFNREDVEIIEKSRDFQGYFGIDRYVIRHRAFEGGWFGPIKREVFERGHAAAMLPYDPQTREFVMCEQFRIGAYAANWPAWQLELVAGIIETGETAEDVIRRESIEECGRAVSDLIPIQSYLVSPGGTSESIDLFFGRVSVESGQGIFGVPEEGENIRTLIVPETALLELLKDGKLSNAATLIAAQWFALNRSRILEKWETAKPL